jgi:hypothetical protein
LLVCQRQRQTWKAKPAPGKIRIANKVALRKFHRFVLVMFLLGVLLLPAPAAGQDQTGGSLIIGTPDTLAFPSIRFPMEAYDEQGDFLSGLEASDLQILENGQSVPVDQVEIGQNGLQVTVALNTNASMISTARGSSVYAEIQAAMIDWIQQRPSPSLDDFSLATPTGLYLIRSRDPAQWEKAILEYQPNANAEPNLVGLADALDLATDPLGRPQMKRAILFITPALTPALLSSLPDYTSRARQIGVSIYVWLAAASETADVAPALQDLATQTGGRLNLLTPAAARPEIEAQLERLRKRYEIQYTSMISASGVHSLSVQLENGTLGLVSNQRSLNLTVLPPNPIFLSPPPSLALQASQAPAGETAVLTPQEVELNILVEFPDQYKRSLKATRLYVNGELAAENLQPPFDRFIWKLAGISKSGQQMLRVEAQDTLNISGTSLEIPVEVIVNQPQTSIIAGSSNRNLWVAVAAMTLAGAALAIVLVISGRKNKINWRRLAAERSRWKDPITQPVLGQGNVGYQRKKGETPTQPHNAAVNVKSKPRPAEAAPPSPARLVGLAENEQPLAGGTIPLSEEGVTFGSDPEQAIQVLTSSTVESLHASIFCNSAGEYFLADHHSVAGTWINYAPVSGHGARLEDGDLVHIGRVMFRFEQLEPGHPRRTIQVLNAHQEQRN